MKSTIIVKIKGGIGNQLFTYSAARRLALINNAEILIDSKTGFRSDAKYKREYALDRFHVSPAICNDKLTPRVLSKLYNRGNKLLNKLIPFDYRNYIFQEKMDFDSRLLNLKFEGKIIFEGYWQSASYFSDIEEIIRADLRIHPPCDSKNSYFSKLISKCTAVGVHIRSFSNVNNFCTSSEGFKYYQKAISLLESSSHEPHYFLFSDAEIPDNILSLFPGKRFTVLGHNRRITDSIYDLYLMSKCSHFIIANSTFSWWGAWLSKYQNKIVIYPNVRIVADEGKWGFDGLIPDEWLGIAL